MEIALTIGSLLNAPNLTLFVLGLLVPCVGKKGAIVGGLSCLLFLLVLVGEKIYKSTQKVVHYRSLKTSIEECDFMINQTVTTSTTVPPLVASEDPDTFFIFRVSMFYYTMMGATVGIVAALITSYLTDEMDAANVNPDLLSPVIHRLVQIFFYPSKTEMKSGKAPFFFFLMPLNV